MENDKYGPVSCGLYDKIEAIATKKVTVEVIYKTPEGASEETIAAVSDIYSKDGAEYMQLDNGREIRLDYIIKFNEETFNNNR